MKKPANKRDRAERKGRRKSLAALTAGILLITLFSLLWLKIRRAPSPPNLATEKSLKVTRRKIHRSARSTRPRPRAEASLQHTETVASRPPQPPEQSSAAASPQALGTETTSTRAPEAAPSSPAEESLRPPDSEDALPVPGAVSSSGVEEVVPSKPPQPPATTGAPVAPSVPAGKETPTEVQEPQPQERRFRIGPRLTHPTEWSDLRCGIIRQAYIVIRDDDTWDAFRRLFEAPPMGLPWRAGSNQRVLVSTPRLPDIDFEKMLVVGVFLGRVQDGHQISINHISPATDGKTLVIEYGKNLPLPNPMKSGSLTEPYVLKVIPRFNGRVSFTQVL